jgi:salicylate hydroxylase
MQHMTQSIVIAGGGIGGLAAAYALGRVGHTVELLEKSSEFHEFGAGIQLGPNVVRILQQWGQMDALRAVAAFPPQLEVRSAMSSDLLGVLPLGTSMESRYGAPYATIARADMQQLLLNAARSLDNVRLHLSCEVTAVAQSADGVNIETNTEATWQSPLLVGADGVWSKIRSHVVADGPPRVTGHLAFRAMLPQSELPVHVRTDVVTAWMGPDFHVVQYPVRGGEWMNVVAIVHGTVVGDPAHWEHGANAGELRARLANAGTGLLDLIHAIPSWRLWALSDRPPMGSAQEHGKGRIVLVGDAAHPMRPYLAQGAGMAIEDAHQLAQMLAANPQDVPQVVQQFGQARWQRNARVQARAIRNGKIFHLSGPVKTGRDLSIKLLGSRLLDVPWLYSGN